MSSGTGIYPKLRQILSKFRIQSVQEPLSKVPPSTTIAATHSSTIFSSPSENAIQSTNKPLTLNAVFPIETPSPFAPLTVQLDYPIHLEEVGENRRSQDIANAQAPNRPIPWSTGQISRHEAMTGPKFTGIDFSKQPRPEAAIAFVDSAPIEFIDGRKVACDGGGPLGHPKVYINLDRNVPMSCMYCGKKFQQNHGHGHTHAHAHH